MIFFSTGLVELIRSADLVVAMGGYNTIVEILVAKKPAILVPRGAPRMEQRMRAKLMSNLGLAWVIQPEENLVPRLAELIQGALAGARPVRNCWNAVDLQGVHRVGNVLDDLLGRRARPPAKHDMTQTPPRPIGYMLKRYPRLSETFILNEMRALERLGTHLRVFSLMNPASRMARSTVCARASAASGSANELYFAGAFTLPARMAASLRLKSVAGLPKKRSDAAWMPYTPAPKYTRLRYSVRILSLL